MDIEFTQYERTTLYEDIDTLLGFTADEAYEGWNDYWTFHEEARRRLMDVLREFRQVCIEETAFE